ncbi:circularly permuted type 2 ATP-grasp protein [Marinobacter sp. M216]|uniref:Circularly permuted type 2 ATP-grasp protein n=1 Tax=Marinobacter albus TaxID=3030833 RepID=A0ABT7HE51_9GAMM|nr:MULTISPECIES: circularly permuted type 2 ATP-grasp protein [unclassified Marinobacter]MBW7472075.1 circularly permuted type 2 ATP-grasp protein [Marinobacter sp. F4218]MDK9558645.1 circularly permuted type 2 ATP-grasp protein [Marinobacter sp. M216]
MLIQTPDQGLFDELFDRDNKVRPHCRMLEQWLINSDETLIAEKRREADVLFQRLGITFNVYGEDQGADRLIPFDLIPRVISASDWHKLQSGLRQRVQALNRFLFDIYHDYDIVKAGVISAEQVFANPQYQPGMQALKLPRNLYCHIAGIDLIRNNDGDFYVLEDNLRCPSGVSYMLENRRMMMRLFPELFAHSPVAPVEHYPNLLGETLRAASLKPDPTVVVLTPGRFNSAYFEHAFLARQMGVELVEGADLFVHQNKVFMKTTVGPQQVDVIYRRIDDDFLDPLAGNPDSMLGVPGLYSAYRTGNVVLTNAMGTGVGDDKSIYPYVPDMIRFYLDEEPILKNVPTWQCRKKKDLQYVLDHLPELVVKEAQGAGGYGMLIGPKASKQELATFRSLLKARPQDYIAQPTLSLSTCPTFVDEGIAPRHLDLRPFVLSGKKIQMVPGGLTRVALKKGSLVVNSSQGGGTKDTWVLEDDLC